MALTECLLSAFMLTYSLALLAFLPTCLPAPLLAGLLTCSLAGLLTCSLAYLLACMLASLLRTLLDSLECIRNSFIVILSIITWTSHIPSSRAPVGAKTCTIR